MWPPAKDCTRFVTTCGTADRGHVPCMRTLHECKEHTIAFPCLRPCTAASPAPIVDLALILCGAHASPRNRRTSSRWRDRWAQHYHRKLGGRAQPSCEPLLSHSTRFQSLCCLRPLARSAVRRPTGSRPRPYSLYRSLAAVGNVKDRATLVTAHAAGEAGRGAPIRTCSQRQPRCDHRGDGRRTKQTAAPGRQQQQGQPGSSR